MKKQGRWLLAGAALGIVGTAIWATGCGPGQEEIQTSAPESFPATVRFQAVIYETLLPPERVGELDAKALAAGSPQDLTKALGASGATKTLYQVDQSIELADGRITIGSRVPMVTRTRVTERGDTLNTVQYQEVGAAFRIKGSPAAQGHIDLRMEVELSSLFESPVELAKGSRASTIRRVQLMHMGLVKPGVAFVALSIDSTTKDKDGNAVAFICRAVVSP